jgi:hypothetical protein
MGFGDSWHPSQPRDVVAMDGADARKKDKSKKAKGTFFLFVCGPKKELKLTKTRPSPEALAFLAAFKVFAG